MACGAQVRMVRPDSGLAYVVGLTPVDVPLPCGGTATHNVVVGRVLREDLPQRLVVLLEPHVQ